MIKQPITKEQWDKYLTVFRQDRGNVNAAARAVPEYSYRQAKRAWEKGFEWASFPEAREPIKVYLEREQEETRLAIARHEAGIKAEAEHTKQNDAAQTRLAEAQMIRLGRASITALLASTTRIASGAAQVGDAVAESLKALGARKETNGQVEPLSMAEVKSMISILARVGQTVRQVTEAAKGIIEAERIVLGEPTNILKVTHSMEDLSVEDAERRIQAAARAFERAKSAGLFGGQAPSSPRLVESTLEPKSKAG